MSSASKGRYRENLVKEKLLNEGYIVIRASASKSFLPIRMANELESKFGDYPKPDLSVNPTVFIDPFSRRRHITTRLIAVVDEKSFSAKKAQGVCNFINREYVVNHTWYYEVWIYKGHKKFEIID